MDIAFEVLVSCCGDTAIYDNILTDHFYEREEGNYGKIYLH